MGVRGCPLSRLLLRCLPCQPELIVGAAVAGTELSALLPRKASSSVAVARAAPAAVARAASAASAASTSALAAASFAAASRAALAVVAAARSRS
jgi:hypothetical protein